MESKQLNKESIINFLILFFFGVYLFYEALPIVRVDITINDYILGIIFIILLGFACYKIARSAKEKRWYVFSMQIISIILCTISYIVVKYEFVIWIGIIVSTLSEIDYKKILTAYLIVIGWLLLLTVCLSLFNQIENIVYLDNDRIRSCWGTGYPTNLAAWVLALAGYIWIKSRNISEWYLLIPSLISFCISYYVSDSNTPIICSLLLIIVIALDCLIKNKDRLLSKNKNLFDILFLSIFPIFSIAVFLLIYLYHFESPIAYKLDSLMHSRIGLAHKAFHTYGIHPFGSIFDMIGAGGTNYSGIGEYNFIDVSYALMLIRYGWVVFILFGIFWETTLYKALKANNYRTAIIMVIIAIHSLSEHRLVDLNFNIFLVCPFAHFKNIKQEELKNIKQVNQAIGLTTIFSLLSFILFKNKILMYCRTFMSIHKFNELSIKPWNTPTFIVGLGILCVLGILYLIYKLLLNLLLKKDIKKYSASLLLILIFSSISFLISFKETLAYYEDYKVNLENEKTVIEIIEENKQGNLYSSEVPLFYDVYFGGFTTKLKEDEELAKEENATFIIDVNFDSKILYQLSYCWLQISDDHAIFTNDSQVIETLRSDGYLLYPYNAYEHTVDLNWEAGINNVILNENGSYPINSTSRLWFGPYINLYRGTYSLNFRMSGLENSEVDEVGVLTIKAYYGQSILNNLTIYASDFNENNEYIGSLNFYSPNAMNIEFVVESLNECNFNIERLSYARIE